MPDENSAPIFTFGGDNGGPTVDVTVSADKLQLRGEFRAGQSPGGKMLVWSELSEALQIAGLGRALLERPIQDALFRFNTGRPEPETIVIAQGQLPVAERPAYLKLEPKFYDHHFVDRGGLQVDFKSFSPFVIVRKGELLATGIRPRPGVAGFDVYGEELPAGRKEIKVLKPGPHTLFAHGKVFSKLAGRFTLEGEVFDVSDVLELDSGVGYGTGNLIFPGSLIVKGMVSDGFKLAAGGGITVKGPLDASEVMSHGNLEVEGGIIGKKPGLVRVGGQVRALFVEHCQVEALGDISVAKALLHATVFTNADLKLDDGGRIVASSLWVRGNLTCAALGGENGPVRVVAGSDFVVHRKLEAVRAKYQALEAQLGRAQQEGTAPEEAQVAQLQAFIDEVNVLTSTLFVNPQTQITVTNTALEGTVLEIGFASLTLVKPAKGVVFSLSADGKTIVSQPIAKASGPAAQK